MPLRPELYRRLKEHFRHVVIASENSQMISRYESDPLTNRMQLKIISPGEYYRVSCPFCTDTRKRLWINHMWGLWDTVTESHNLWLCVCYNEQCLRLPERRNQLFKEVFDPTAFRECVDVLEPGDIEECIEHKPVTLPGQLVPVDQLPEGHEAATYLIKRGFDLSELSTTHKVSYCFDAIPEMGMALGRIFIPVFKEAQMVGWQARTVGEPWNKFIPKYYCMPGWKRGHYVYNYDSAKQFNHVVICEGPTDVWRYGPEAVCLFGKMPAPMQIKTLIDTWPVHILMLDSDVPEKEVTEIEARLDQYGQLNKRILVKLPPGQDPGSMNVEYMRALVNATALEKGITLTKR